MRMALEKILKPGLSDGAWFSVAILLGAAWGISVGPLHLPPEAVAGTGLKVLGWMVVAVLCLCMGVMARLMLFRKADTTPEMVLLRPAPFAGPEVPSGAATPPPQPEQTGNIDPFLAALDYLGHAQATVRIGGVLALERVVRQGGDMRICAGTLAAYIQQWAGENAPKRDQRPAYDVVAALAVLSRLLPSSDPLRNLADLRRTNLAGLELPDADLSRFHLEHADLSGADLRGANFSGVNFRGADLRGALLSGAIFAGASLRGADLTGAVLSDDEFGAADMSMAGNISAAQLLHIRFHPGRPPRLPAGMLLPNQTAAAAV